MKVLNYTGLQNLWTNIRNYITVHTPTKTSDLTNDSNFVDTSNSAVASGITSAKVTDYDTHLADTNIHVTTADKSKWNNGVSQSYVLRYSSSSVTDNSTVSYSTLDNTDNIKSGDKVIDVDGVLFSITAIDTANSTFTVGSALIDLAQDGNVVHTSGNETVTGTKTLDNVDLPFKNSAELGVSGGGTNITFSDKNGQLLCTLKTTVFSSGTPVFQINLTQKVDNTIYTTNGIVVYQSANSKTIQIRPSLANDNADGLKVELGSSANRYNRIYGLAYYYGNDNVEFSNKFVTTDTSQTVGSSKVFSSSPTIYNSDTSGTTANLNLRNQNVTKGDTSSSGNQNIRFADVNDKILGRIQLNKISNGTSSLNLRADSIDTSNNDVVTEVQILASRDGSKSLSPQNTNDVNLGRTLAKWKNIYVNQINSLTPSSLSMPAITGTIDISAYVTDLTGVNVNTYTPLANGYIVITCDSTDVDYIKLSNNLDFVSVVDNTNNQFTSGILGVCQPCVAGVGIQIRIKSSALKTARFIPCQGNI